ncbi:1-phosphatidylinositol phosphodiesterase-like [Rhinichthys klamathensis goyatoka]|uniref:1-phosphatidylinositol phosphodiesterase-like n=1 Tax=Rhinichthys klamathensis goyatoka TaxID=3034132 RepID=UPI0024B50A68|nr:1-phosphatidylinositol phosphodiesterase-like [Rhinichthys klamathensis goyatoka]
METLDNNKLISTLTIPGTHDALALHGGAPTECQAWSTEDQLKAGIRYFDLRVSGFGLRIMHGPIYQRTSLPEVICIVKTFLTQFRNEVVLLRVKPVFPMKGKVPNLVEKLIKNDNDIYKNEKIPSIGEVRGKIVFVQKNSFQLGIKLFETDQIGDHKVTKVQDKVTKIKQHLEKAATQCRTDSAEKISLSYSSGTSLGTYMGFFLLPQKLAKKINPSLIDHLAKELKKSPKPCFGIIAMDFPSFDLIEMVIKFNT